MSLSPVLLQELRVRMRGGTAYALLTAIILAFGGFTLTTYRAIIAQIRPLPLQISTFNNAGVQVQPTGRILVAQRGPLFFLLMAIWAVIIMALVVPASTSGTFSRERERHTLKLLVGTPVRPFSIVLGKLLGAVSYVLLLLAAGIPLLSVVVMFGGITVDQAISAAVILAVVTFAFGALGVFFSSLTDNSLLASLLTYTVILGLTIGSYAAYLLSLQAGSALDLRGILYLSPVAAMMSALSQTNSQLGTLISPYFHEPGSQPFGLPLSASTVPLWYVTLALYVLVGLGLAYAASRAIDPLRRWL